MKRKIASNSKIISMVIASAWFTLMSCDDFLKISPPKTEIVSENVFTSDASARSTVSGIYSLMMTNSSFTKAGMEHYTGIASDELINYGLDAEEIQFYQNALTSKNSEVLQVFWAEAFKYINNANGIIEGLNKSTQISAPMKNELEGEAKFIRAFCHFYLTVLFGDIPYLTTTDYKQNRNAGRKPTAEVYQLIEADLLDAKKLLTNDYSFSANERIVPNSYAASAMLARVYLYMRQWANAEQEATAVIDNASLYHLVTDLNDVFLANSKEAIWQLKPVIPNSNTPQAQLFILTGPPNAISRKVSLRDNLVASFEAEDQRRVNWIGEYNGAATWYYPFKYKVASSTSLTEYNMVLRLAEQYLIRSEARAQQGNLPGALDDLNAIRNRAGLSAITAIDKAALLNAILNERKIELFAEWGHRWFDLARSGRIDEIMPLTKANWNSTDQLFPIPESERLLDQNLSQNPGY